MSTPLEIASLLLLAAIAAGVVPTLVQIHRTARTLDRFLGTAEQQLAQIADDVHAARGTIERVAGSLQKPIGDISSFTQVVKHTGTMIQRAELKISNLVQAVTFVARSPIGLVKSLFSIFRKTEKEKT